MAKVIIIALGVVALCCLTVYASQGAFTPDECCFHFIEDPLPKKRVADYRSTSSHCAKSAFILKMKNGKEFCVRHDADWVANVTKFVDERR
ncbi:C-C motif chemokine 3-like [Boleophthalmus pectinirostris]|uniref:C-C motif chemokine 3-like n=1 Tax=Boleophthalmus pectinirostris TaxID=150288 RepID=UPI000A1C60AC|nr:C-C motif chemokine 3-like [Boleophthalmus pectinirostris]